MKLKIYTWLTNLLTKDFFIFNYGIFALSTGIIYPPFRWIKKSKTKLLSDAKSNILNITDKEKSVNIHLPKKKSLQIRKPIINRYIFKNIILDSGRGHLYNSDLNITYIKYPSNLIYKSEIGRSSILFTIASNFNLVLHKKDVQLLPKVLFLSGGQERNYYHWLIEILSTFKLLTQDINNKHYKIAVNEDVLIHKSIKTSFEYICEKYKFEYILLKNNRQYFAEEIICLDYINIIKRKTKMEGLSFTFYAYYYNDSIYWLSQQLLKGMSKNLEIKSNDIFPTKFICKRSSSRRNYNEKEIIEIAKQKGFKEVNILDYSLWEQIHLFNNAKKIISPSGAILTNLIFCKPNISIYSWLPRSYENFSSFSQIAKIFNLNFHTILYDSGLDIHSDYYLDTKQFKESLEHE